MGETPERTASIPTDPNLQKPPNAEQLTWLRQHAIALDTVEAENGFDDLAPLAEMIGSARVVGLGEGTHGTREHFQAKHRLVEFLVEHLGFAIFAIEANMPEAYALDAYVQGGSGDVETLIRGMYFWTWSTHEVRDMVEWMRAYNHRQAASGSPHRVHFTGIDMQVETVALRNVREYLAEYDPGGASDLLTRLERLNGYKRSDRENRFGCVTGRLPVEAARGKSLRLSGWIRTHDVRDGWAGLWVRIDGPTRRFDNMSDRGVHGTRDWTHCTIELDVPDDAREIYFGLLLSGPGKGWFDALEIGFDGAPWTSEDFDLSFEAPDLRGLAHSDPLGHPPAPGYCCELDASIARSGTQSLRLESEEQEADALSDEEVQDLTQSVLDDMLDARERFVAATDAATADWIIQNARIVRQWAGQGTAPNGSYAYRDRCMADNISWLLEHNPDARVIVWAHNAHIDTREPKMGLHLRARLGPRYVNVAFCASHGEYRAVKRSARKLGTCSLSMPPPGSFEAMLEADGRPLLLVDLRRAAAGDSGSSWLTETRPFGGWIGALETIEHYTLVALRDRFDLVLYTRDTTPSRSLRD